MKFLRRLFRRAAPEERARAREKALLRARLIAAHVVNASPRGALSP